MLHTIFQLVNSTRLFVIIAFIASVLFLNLKKEKNELLLIILTINFITELTTAMFVNSGHSSRIGLLYSISVIIHHSLWLLLLMKSVPPVRYLKYILYGFILFGIYDLIFQEGDSRFNYLTFIVGALLYIIIFIYQSFLQLQRENYSFFPTNTYLLLFAPILFFFGMSFMFGFRSNTITSTLVFQDVKLYTVINQFVNIVYYGLIMVYIFKEKKYKYVQ